MNRIILPFVLAALLFWAGGACWIGSSWKVAAWPAVPGRVVESKVVLDRDGARSGELIVAYQNGGPQQVRLRSPFSSASATLVEGWLAEPHAFVVNPEDPQDLRLRPLQSAADWIWPVALIGGGFLFVAIPLGLSRLAASAIPVPTAVLWTFVPCGLICLALGVFMELEKRSIHSTWIPVQATVQECHLRPAGRRSYLDVRLSYSLAGSTHEVRVQSAGSLNETELPIGTHLDILVSPKHPDLVEWQPRNFWLEIGKFGGGMVFLGFAALSRKLA